MIRFPKKHLFGSERSAPVDSGAEGPNPSPASENGPLRVVDEREPLEVRPTVAWVVTAWVLALAFAWGLHHLFSTLPPYAHEVAKNLKGFPQEWADLLLSGVEKFLLFAVALSALAHTLWRFTTTYTLTDREVLIRSVFPTRRVDLVPLAGVKRVGFSQSLFGYALNYGHVELDPGGASGWVILRNCPKPEAFLKEVQKRLPGNPPC